MSKLTKGYKTGKAQQIGDCCREIRIFPVRQLGDIAVGYNTLTDEVEKWMLIKINNDYNKSIVQRIY